MDNFKLNIMKKLTIFKKEAESRGLHVWAIGLKGSQNYNLHDEDSDVDANLVFIPTPQQLRNNNSYKIELEFGECTCHNLYSFANIVAKGNPQWIEICNTEYIICDNNFHNIFENYKVNPSALKGMLMEKVHCFDKLYPSREKYIKEFGYDPKQLHHIIRLYDILNRGVKFYKYEGVARDWMLDIKRGRFPKTKEEAFKMRDEYVHRLGEIYKHKKIEYKEQKIDYSELDRIYIEYLIEMRFKCI